jgi:ABC-type phosphate transport system auxiliary subunit
MSGTSMVVAIIAIVAFTVLRIIKYNTQGGRHRGEQPLVPSAREGELEREVIELRKRLEVLERITTDANSLDHRQSRAIAAEIESLRER